MHIVSGTRSAKLLVISIFLVGYCRWNFLTTLRNEGFFEHLSQGIKRLQRQEKLPKRAVHVWE